MLKSSVYMRLLCLAAAAALIAAAVTYVTAPSAKAPRQVAKQSSAAPPERAPQRPAAPAQRPAASAPSAAVETDNPGDAVAPRPAAPPPVRSVAPSPWPAPPAPPSQAAAPPAAAPPSSPPPPPTAAQIPPSARASLNGRATAADPPAAAASAAPSGRVDLNRGSVAELNALRGAGLIGRHIVAHRPYASPEDLLKKRVLNRTTYDRIKDQVRVGAE
jgi:hypothetical protein